MSNIEWTRNDDGSKGKTWNPVTGCDKISAGCTHCYAEGIAKRFWGDRKFSDVQFHEDRLLQPLSWKKPQKIFVNSMSDLFHEDVTDEQLNQIFAVMALSPRHTYQVLTKRPQKMLEYFQREDTEKNIFKWACAIADDFPKLKSTQHFWPIPNVWLGVTCENQKTANERIPLLRHCPAAVRFLSCEPLLESIDLFNVDGEVSLAMQALDERETMFPADFIDWVIVGGESGHKARVCYLGWIDSIVEQCRAAAIPVFVKQLGSKPEIIISDKSHRYLISDKKGGQISDFPAYLQIRDFPIVS